MSKLYNTLEKIRTGEQSVFSEKKSASAKGTGQNADTNRKRLFILLGASGVLTLLLVLFFVGSQRKNANPPIIADAVNTEATAPTQATDQPVASVSLADTSPETSALPPVAPPISPAGSSTDQYRRFNDTALALIEENQHWRGIYFLEQARKLQPEKVEPLINMAVALAELGLRAPAKRLFLEAHALAPNHPLLRKNLDLLGQADFFDDQWVASLFSGAIQPGQTRRPQ